MNEKADLGPKSLVSLSTENTVDGAVERALLAEARSPAQPGYDPKVDLEAMRDMRQVLENRLGDPAEYRAPGATTELQILTAPGQFPEFADYPHRLPAVLRDSVVNANEPDSSRQQAYLKHVQNAMTAATETSIRQSLVCQTLPAG